MDTESQQQEAASPRVVVHRSSSSWELKMIAFHVRRIGVTLVAIVMSSLLVGCASPPTKQPPLIENAPPGKALLYIYRNSDTARIRDVSILVDGKVAAVLGNREYVSIAVDSGPHEVKTKWAFDVSIPVATHSLVAAPGDVSFLRLDIAHASNGITITGNPLVPILANVEFGSRFVSQDRMQAYEEMSFCLRASAK